MKTTVLALTLLAAALCFSATTGVFRGKIVIGDPSGPPHKWIYVQASARSVRRVEISNARVSYSSAVAARNRLPRPANSLQQGTEVEVTAAQDSSGEWKATSVRILAVAKE